MKAWKFRILTLVHKYWVFLYCLKFSTKLMYRAIIHDASKFGSFESKGFGKLIDRLANSTYGSPEYKAMLDELGVVLKHHYTHNPHHPEYHTNGYMDMSLIDLVEMFIDWKSSIKKHKDGNIDNSLKIGQDRHNMSDDIISILRNSK